MPKLEWDVSRQGLLPLGSIVMLSGAHSPVMIVGRAQAVGGGDKPGLYDYGACMWPEGIVDSRLTYFNHDAIERIVALGYSNRTERQYGDVANVALFMARSEKRGQSSNDNDGTGKRARR